MSKINVKEKKESLSKVLKKKGIKTKLPLLLSGSFGFEVVPFNHKKLEIKNLKSSLYDSISFYKPISRME